MREFIEFWDTDRSWIDIQAQAKRLTIEVITSAVLDYSCPAANSVTPVATHLSPLLHVYAATSNLPPAPIPYRFITNSSDKTPHNSNVTSMSHDNAYIRRHVCDIV
ncbi:hypothetical protein [Mycobacterium lepromatosis]|uniref:hypothetical protein n=1 Tax=Mycobacterium lepromatosis TaxID=480418 RepID=UPI0012DFEDD8|nr:hypothetical protein [Mycobacterium lepromatosis]